MGATPQTTGRVYAYAGPCAVLVRADDTLQVLAARGHRRPNFQPGPEGRREGEVSVTISDKELIGKWWELQNGTCALCLAHELPIGYFGMCKCCHEHICNDSSRDSEWNAKKSQLMKRHREEREVEDAFHERAMEGLERTRKEMEKYGTNMHTHPYTAEPGCVTQQVSTDEAQYRYNKHKPTDAQMDEWEREAEEIHQEVPGDVFDPYGAKALAERVAKLEAVSPEPEEADTQEQAKTRTSTRPERA